MTKIKTSILLLFHNQPILCLAFCCLIFYKIHDNGTTSLSRISGKKRLALGIPIGLNSASIDDLTALPGVGIKLAERIVEYKKLNGSFKSVDELDNVKGL